MFSIAVNLKNFQEQKYNPNKCTVGNLLVAFLKFSMRLTGHLAYSSWLLKFMPHPDENR
jgi:hypothetical protein